MARREYARWLLQTNNRLYKNQPSRQIRLAQSTDISSFLDIPANHPDFAAIQGLANAGLINGSGDRFRPNDPLLREELVQWKIPLDLRQPLPSATLETVSQAWGFKDSDRINENALSAILLMLNCEISLIFGAALGSRHYCNPKNLSPVPKLPPHCGILALRQMEYRLAKF